MFDSCDCMDCSLPDSSLHGILQARILEWVAISFSNIPNRSLSFSDFVKWLEFCKVKRKSKTICILIHHLSFFSFSYRHGTSYFLGFLPLALLLEAPEVQKRKKIVFRCNLNTVMLKVIIILSP